MTTPPIRIAAVGTGYFSQFHYDAWRRLEVDLAGVCSLDREGAEATANSFPGCRAFEDFEEMLDAVKPELVDLIVPPQSQFALINAAVHRRTPLICQKPFTRSLAEAEAAVELAREADTLIAVHENFRFQPWYRKVKALMDDGTIGEPYQVSFRLRPGDGQGREAYLSRQPYFQKMERFLVHETAIHLIDVFRYLLGPVASVSADLARLNPHIAGEDAGLIIFHFAAGARGLFDGNRLSDHVAENRRLTMGDMLIEGSGGCIRLNGDGQIFTRAFGENHELEVAYDWQHAGFAGDSVYQLQKHVLDHLQNGGPLVNAAADYLENLRIEEAVYRSHETGARVEMD